MASADRHHEPHTPRTPPGADAAARAGLRLPPERRLRRSGDFQRLYANGRRFAQERFTAVVQPNAVGGPRLGLSVAARSARRAVERNRVRRLIRESFRHHQGRLPALDIVVGLRGPLGDADNAQLRGALDRLWHKLSRCEFL